MNFNFSEDQLLMKEEVKKLLDKENSVKRNRNVLEGEDKFDKESVSYTHLTLPTKRLV